MTAQLGFDFFRHKTATMVAVPALLLLATISCFVPIHNFMPTMGAGAVCIAMQGVLFPPTASKFKVMLLSVLITVVYLFIRKLTDAPKTNLAASVWRRCKELLIVAYNPLREVLSRGILHPKIYNAAFIF